MEEQKKKTVNRNTFKYDPTGKQGLFRKSRASSITPVSESSLESESSVEPQKIERVRSKRRHTVSANAKRDFTQEKLNRLMAEIKKNWDRNNYKEVVSLGNKVFVVEPTTIKGIFQKRAAEKKKQAALKILGFPERDISECISHSPQRASSRSSGFFSTKKIEPRVERASAVKSDDAKEVRRGASLRRVSGEW